MNLRSQYFGAEMQITMVPQKLGIPVTLNFIHFYFDIFIVNGASMRMPEQKKNTDFAS